MSRYSKSKRSSVASTLLVSVIVLSCAAAAGLWLARLLSEKPPTTIMERAARRDFSLVDTNGADVSLASFNGRWLLLFFGFTSCPEACPMALTNVSETLRELGEDGVLLQPAFVSVDPERDTKEVIKDYISHFDERIVGLTGTPDALAAMAKDYGVFYRRRALDGDDYTVDHSTAFYLVSPSGDFQRAFASDMDPADFAADLKAAMTPTREAQK